VSAPPPDGNGATASPRPELVSDGIPAQRPRWLDLATSGDHKDVGRMLITGGLSFLVVAALGFVLMRLQLAVPENDLITPQRFDRLLTVDSASLIFFFALPFIFGLFAYVLPLQIGARGLAFPRLANFSFWLFAVGALVLFVTFIFTPPEAGFNPWPPLSSTTFSAENGVDAWILGCGLSLIGIVLLAVNLLATVRAMRAPGMAWRRVPMFSWAATVCSYVIIIGGAAMLAAMTMLEFDRHFSGVFFDSGEGGAPSYWQHLSWIFFTGVWLILLISAIGAISEIIATFSGRPLLGRAAIMASMAAIGGLGLLSWMQNMYSAAIPIGFLYFAQAMALLLVIPFGTVIFSWLATLAGGTLRLRAPVLYAMAAISTLSIGLALELMQSVIPVAWQIAGSASATAASGYVVVGAGVLGGFAALHYWYPKMTGHTMGEQLSTFALVAIFIGVHLTFIPLFLAGLEGQPTDIYKYFDVHHLDVLNLISTIGSVILFLGIAGEAINAVLSRENGPRAGHDPWGGSTLEWFAPAPPPVHNFDVVPDVRSAEPLRDLREAIGAQESSHPGEVVEGEPVA
jgi:heme/copper-type cytochrome/quinol oxidase subunit 1